MNSGGSGFDRKARGFPFRKAILEASRFRGLAKGRVNWERLRDFTDVRGIRIEDDVLVTDTGREVLTAEIPKTADAIESLVGSRA